MKIKEIKQVLKSMYDVKDVEEGYWYWFWKLYNIVIDMFEYHNLPESLTKEEIENNLILTGHCSIIHNKKTGKLFAPFSRIFDYDEYYQPTKMVFANPRIVDYHTYTIGKDCSVIYNTSMKYRVWNLKVDGGLHSFIARYARMLADIESTINIYTVNMRVTSYPTADGEKVADSIRAFFDKITMGERAIVSDDAIINRFRNVEINSHNTKDGINDLLIARDKTLEMFYRDIGIRMNNPKKAQVNEEEIEANDQLLLISLNDMLNARNVGWEDTNNLFGTSTYVTLNPRFDISTYSGGVYNE